MVLRWTLTCALAAAFCFAAVGCKRRGDPPVATPASSAPAAGGGPGAMVKLSQFGGSLYCSAARGGDGTLHAIFTDRTEPGKSAYLYYRASRDGGATWSEPKNLSDDESGLSAYYCRTLVDGKGRVYAIWKFLTAASDSLDGPGSAGCGILAFRCLEGGAWSKIIRLTTRKDPSTSFFAANGPGGAVNLVWAQGNPDVDWEPKGGVPFQCANWLRQAVLDGGAEPTPADLFRPAPLPTQEQINAAHAAGRDFPYAELSVKSDGLWALRGYIDAGGAAHFVGEHYPVPKDQYGNSGPYFLAYWDGKTARHLQDEKSSINFNNPPTLLRDSRGKEHLIRKPDNTEKECVRDYPVLGGALGDPVDVVVPEKAPGTVVDWQATALPGGRMAVTCAMSQKGGWAPDDVELYLSTSDGDGKWSAPVNLTENAARQKFASHETAAGGVATSSTYRPDFAEAADLGDGRVGVLMVNTESTIIGITNSGVTASGRVAGSLATGQTASPWVFFHR